MPSPVRVEVLCVGTELLSGKVNTHVGWLARTLQGTGLSISRETTLGDTLGEIAAGIGEALKRCRVLIVCGGLGPTFDDLTREGAAQALGLRLRYHPELYARIRAKYLRHYKRVPQENRRQAYLLEGARALPNEHGSAPGQILHIDGKTLILLPGPPWEMQPMFLRLLPALRSKYAPRAAVLKTAFHLCDIPESAADELLKPLVSKARPGLEYTILAGNRLVDFHVTARAESRDRAARLMAFAGREVRRLVGQHVFGTDSDTLESVAGDILRKRGLKFATAESCTAGLLSARVTSVPGSSDYYMGGIVAYSNDVKRRELGVSPRTLQSCGAVSRQCACEMAAGALRKFQADAAMSLTGIAGPGGGTPSKPVGLTFISLARRGRAIHTQELRLSGSRDQNRERAVSSALALLLRALRAGTSAPA